MNTMTGGIEYKGGREYTEYIRRKREEWMEEEQHPKRVRGRIRVDRL